VLSDTFLVISGDAVTDFDLSSAMEFHRKRSALATMLLYSVDDPSQFGIVEMESDGRIMRFIEKPRPTETFTNTVNTGIYILEPDVIDSIPFDTVYDFSRDLFPKFLQNQEPFYAIRADGYWCDVGNLAQYRNVHFDALVGRVKLNIPGARVADGVWLGLDAAIDPSVRLMSPLYVGSGTSIESDAELGRFAVVGNMSRIGEKAQVTHSVVGARTMVGQNSQVVGSVLGNGYRLADGRHLDDEIVVHDGSAAELRAEINSQQANPMENDGQAAAWSGLDLARLADQVSARPLAA
jgi:mannose-1-phosphate guanylyltransferase/phosphomannomutase